MNYTDTELINFLEKQNAQKRYTGICLFRLSVTGRGWRLHETELNGFPSVREALKYAIDNTPYPPGGDIG